MSFTQLLIQIPRGYEEVKWRLECELRLVGEGFPAIPAGRTESARGVRKTIEDHGEGLVGRCDVGLIVHLVRCGIVEGLVAPDATAEAVDAFEIGFYVGLPLAFGPTVATVLETDGGVYGEGGGAILVRRIHIILESVTCDAHVILLVEVVEFEACESLLFHC